MRSKDIKQITKHISCNGTVMSDSYMQPFFHTLYGWIIFINIVVVIIL